MGWGRGRFGSRSVRAPRPHHGGGGAHRPLAGDPFVGNVWANLDEALGWAAAARVGVLLDLHAHPGGKSGEAHTGRARGGGWHVDDWDIDGALDAVAGLAGCYGSAAGACGGGGGGGETPPALLGLSVANEPEELIPPDVLLAFYRHAFAAYNYVLLFAWTSSSSLSLSGKSLVRLLPRWEAPANRFSEFTI
ncbi:hypothetical protein BU14_0720s0007 [Porphyra umbilicalis]|uniref:glucan 1,3-beta-glucosidase n=1 Tax=Porphyra umbilicalis TaxID=2786 RepID=A0A1X6NPP8_PORUM|nr:hypothetical protein BU14_0720s0007 [Porphyra umbilicalis]|eukprot:OSX70567.1 hypothetical protein BU14_0720s0007 [Porphyra umbilicalis]